MKKSFYIFLNHLPKAFFGDFCACSNLLTSGLKVCWTSQCAKFGKKGESKNLKGNKIGKSFQYFFVVFAIQNSISLKICAKKKMVIHATKACKRQEMRTKKGWKSGKKKCIEKVLKAAKKTRRNEINEKKAEVEKSLKEEMD